MLAREHEAITLAQLEPGIGVCWEGTKHQHVQRQVGPGHSLYDLVLPGQIGGGELNEADTDTPQT